jgi:GT2 family glycosyltransferase
MISPPSSLPGVQTKSTTELVDAPKLSVIIVSYNVKHFLEQTIRSAIQASKKVSTEIIVIDNQSVDDSVQMVEERFPEVHLIANQKNTGFAVANNQGMEIASGEYMLLLNPDTVVSEDTFEKVIDFMDDNPEAGGLGVKMIDGTGSFLPESKRAFPTPSVAFWKAFGFSALFPKSRIFGRYHLGFLSEDEVHEVDVLSGAFMLLRKSVIDKIGGLDESFFMYGEDIDLSYRIVQAGYKNYYFPDTRIIHYKGESTKKGSLNYVRMFYAAMKIFAKKHFKGTSAWALILLINVAIYFRAGLALVSRALGKLAWPLLDASIIFGGMYLIKNFWEANIKWLDGVVYPPEYLYINVPLYILIWLGASWFSGAYDRDATLSRIVRGLLLGTLFIAAIYGFLEEGLRFSRGMILSGTIWAMASMTMTRLVSTFVKKGHFDFGEQHAKKILIVGEENESKRVRELLDRYESRAQLMGFVRIHTQDENDERVLGKISELPNIVEVFDIEELIFCAADISSSEIISWMSEIGSRLKYKIVPAEGLSIVGSNSKNSAGDLYAVDIQLAIDEPRNKRNKRLFDLALSMLLILTLPLQLFMVKNASGLIRNCMRVLMGSRTWVAYAENDLPPSERALPKLSDGILNPLDSLQGASMSRQTLDRLNFLYARDYSTQKDFQIVLKSWSVLGR